MAQTPDWIFERTGVRLTPRAKVLVHMILDGLADEPIDWRGSVKPEHELTVRAQQVEKAYAQLPEMLRAVARETDKLDKDEPVTLFDLLHHFESTTRVMFFPGKMP